MGKARPQQWRISWPLTPYLVEAMDQMFETLFRTVRNIPQVLVSGAGFVVQTAAGAFEARTLTPGPGISIINGNGVAGNPVISSATGITGTETFTTVVNQTATLPNSRRIAAGSNITLDTSVASVLTINSSAGGGGFEPLTNGNSTTPELIFTGGGDVIMVPF